MSKAARKKPQPAEEKDEPRQPGTSMLEWVFAGISCLGLLAVLAYLVISAFTVENGPARIEVRPLGVTATADHYVVEFEAANVAGASVAAIEIRGELRDGSEVIEETSMTLDYLPRNSERAAALIFRNDPAAHELILWAGGYATP